MNRLEKIMVLRFKFFSLLLLLLARIILAGENWPAFRGTTGGVVEDTVLPLTWSTTKNIKWSAEIPGRGWSCPIVWSDKIFLTTVASEGEVEKAKKGLYFGGDRNTVSTDIHHWIVFCVDWTSGKILWQKTVHKGQPAEPVHIKNTYASETPVTDGIRVYFYFGNVGVFCFDFAGKMLWEKRLDPKKMGNNWGTASSPALYANKLFIVNDNEEQSYLLALDKKTGEEIFKVDRDEKSNWATPYVWKNSERTELVTCGKGKIRSYTLNGELLWELAPMSVITIPTPVKANGLLYICSGYVGDKKHRPIYAIRPGATGDISPKEGITGEHIAWYHEFGGPYNPSPIAYGDYFYVLNDRGHVDCYDGLTGEIIYEKQKLENARHFTVSPWANDGKLFFLSEDGDTFVVQAGPEFKILGKNRLDEMCMSTPAALRGNLVIRTLTKLHRIEQ